MLLTNTIAIQQVCQQAKYRGISTPYGYAHVFAIEIGMVYQHMNVNMKHVLLDCVNCMRKCNVNCFVSRIFRNVKFKHTPSNSQSEPP